MNIAKYTLVLALAVSAAQAFAGDSIAAVESASVPTEEYTYSKKLDIKRVLSITAPRSDCAPGPVQMTYEDSKGELHILQYQTMEIGCNNG